MEPLQWRPGSIFTGKGELASFDASMGELLLLKVRQAYEVPHKDLPWEIDYWTLSGTIFGKGHVLRPAETMQYPDVRAAMLAARSLAIELLRQAGEDIARLVLEPPAKLAKPKKDWMEEELQEDTALAQKENVQNPDARAATPPAEPPATGVSL